MNEAAYFSDNEDTLKRVYSQDHFDRIAARCRVHGEIIGSESFGLRAAQLADLEVIFSTWGMPALTSEQLLRLPRLKAVFYAAGSVQAFARPFLERGILVVSAWAANAVPVAEFTLAQILLANKGYFRNVRDCADPATRPNAFRGAGNFGATVALLGAGMIGRKVVELLKPFRLPVVVFDPFLSAEEAVRLGVEKVSLADAFRRGNVVSNHLANVPETRGLLGREHFEALPVDATFINTGRGATVVEADLCGVLEQRPDVTALLDVTAPEPPEAGSAFYALPNVRLTSHIAGAMNDELARMADTVVEELVAWQEGRDLRYGVTLDMLKTMA